MTEKDTNEFYMHSKTSALILDFRAPFQLLPRWVGRMRACQTRLLSTVNSENAAVVILSVEYRVIMSCCVDDQVTLQV